MSRPALRAAFGCEAANRPARRAVTRATGDAGQRTGAVGMTGQRGAGLGMMRFGEARGGAGVLDRPPGMDCPEAVAELRDEPGRDQRGDIRPGPPG